MHSSTSLVLVGIVAAPWLILQVVAISSLNDISPSFGGRQDPVDDELMQSLYKRLSMMDPADLEGLQDIDGYNNDNWSPEEEDPRDSRATDIRDPEYLEHSPNTGFIYMSGGAGEGKQHLTPDGSLNNVHQVKSDESLPFYCHPPNPCPKGYTSKDGCQEFVEDSADYQKEWITQMQKKGICSCDEEHMFDCSNSNSKGRDQSILDSTSGDENVSAKERQDLDDVLNKLLEEKHENPYTQRGQKRQSLVAKKSPRIKRDTSGNTMEMELEKMATKTKRNENPYLSGERLPTVAKKGVRSH